MRPGSLAVADRQAYPDWPSRVFAIVSAAASLLGSPQSRAQIPGKAAQMECARYMECESRPFLKPQRDHFRHTDLRLRRQRLLHAAGQPLAVEPSPVHALVDDHEALLDSVAPHAQVLARDLIVGV